jgi:hypothetical protein
MTTKRVISRTDREREASVLLASIHSGEKGLSIPREVMEFYTAMVAKDRFRSSMMRLIVPLIRDEFLAAADWVAIRIKVEAELFKAIGKRDLSYLRNWRDADAKRPNLDCLTALRSAYVAEGLQIFEDAHEYVQALSREI